MSRKTVKNAGRQKQSDGVDHEVLHVSPLHQARRLGKERNQRPTVLRPQGLLTPRPSRGTTPGRGAGAGFLGKPRNLLISTNSTSFPLIHLRLLYPLKRCSPSKTQTKPYPKGHPRDHKCNKIKKQEVINERKSSASLL